MTEKTEAPQTKLSDWQVRMTPRNLDGKRSELIVVQATSKQEAINKALSRKPGHVWDSVIELDEEGSETGNEDENPDEERPAPTHLWAEKWEPTRREGEELTLAQIVHEVVGTGSMCWRETPQGIFDDEKARWAAGGAIDAIERIIWEQTGHVLGQGKKPRRTTPPSGIDPLDLIREQNVDGQLWAIAFAEQFDLPEEHDGTIIGWFANAIETAKSYVRNSPRPADIFGADLPPFESFGEKPEARTNLVPNPALVEGDIAVPGMAQEPEECRQARIQRDADKAAVIELILSYRNPADDETRMRQIKVVMD